MKNYKAWEDIINFDKEDIDDYNYKIIKNDSRIGGYTITLRYGKTTTQIAGNMSYAGVRCFCIGVLAEARGNSETETQNEFYAQEGRRS